MHSYDHQSDEALRKIADLLASAYLRYSAIRRVPTVDPSSLGEDPLDNSGVQSVHGRS